MLPRGFACTQAAQIDIVTFLACVTPADHLLHTRTHSLTCYTMLRAFLRQSQLLAEQAEFKARLQVQFIMMACMQVTSHTH